MEFLSQVGRKQANNARTVSGRALRHAFPIVAFALAIYTYFPGHLSFDSAVMLWQARTGEYFNVSPTILTILWAQILTVWPGSGGLFALQLALFIGGAWGICCAISAVAWKRVAAMLYVLLGTPASIVVTHLWTDAFMIASLVAGSSFVLLSDRFRIPWLLFAAMPLLALGGAVRHNASPALVPIVMWWIVVYFRVCRAAIPPRIGPMVAVAFAVALGVLGASKLIDHAVGKYRVATFTAVQVFDLAGISVRVDEMLIPAFMFPETFTLKELRDRYVPYNNFPLFKGGDGVRQPVGQDVLTEIELEEIRIAWRNAILDHPFAYLSHRLATTSWLFDRFRNDRPLLLAISEEIGSYRGNPVIEANNTDLHRLAINWYRYAIGWWGFAPVTYIAIAIALIVVNWRSRATSLGQFALALSASGLFYIAPMPLVVPSAELRYSGWLFAATSLALLATLQHWFVDGQIPLRFRTWFSKIRRERSFH